MGLYTGHWDREKKKSLRGVLYGLLVVAIGLPCIAGFGMLLGPLDTARTIALLSLLAGWLVAFTWVLVRFSKVVCPRCDTRYSRGRQLVDCPQCGLRMFQDDP